MACVYVCNVTCVACAENHHMTLQHLCALTELFSPLVAVVLVYLVLNDTVKKRGKSSL